MIQETTNTGGAGKVKLLTTQKKLRIERSLPEACNSTTS